VWVEIWLSRLSAISILTNYRVGLNPKSVTSGLLLGCTVGNLDLFPRFRIEGTRCVFVRR
jgi:hypothetical protein